MPAKKQTGIARANEAIRKVLHESTKSLSKSDTLAVYEMIHGDITDMIAEIELEIEEDGAE